MYKFNLKTFSRISLLPAALFLAACSGGSGTSAESDLPDAPDPVFDSIVDARDGKVYRTVKIGEQWWMAENLDYETEGSKTIYVNPYSTTDTTKLDGRSYNWAEAMDLDSAYLDLSAEVAGLVDSAHRGICPAGWHVPAKGEWQTLLDYADLHNGSEWVSASLIDSSEWKRMDSASNRYGFSATPSDGYYNAYYISATEIHREWRTDMPYFYEYHLGNNMSIFAEAEKTGSYFVRCVKD